MVFTCLKMHQAMNRSCPQFPAILAWFSLYFLPPLVSFNKEEREERGKQSPLSAVSDPQRAPSRSFSQTLRLGAWAAGEEADCRGDTRLLEDPGAGRGQRGVGRGAPPGRSCRRHPARPGGSASAPSSMSPSLGRGDRLPVDWDPAAVNSVGFSVSFLLRFPSEWTQNSFPKGSDALGPPPHPPTPAQCLGPSAWSRVLGPGDHWPTLPAAQAQGLG